MVTLAEPVLVVGRWVYARRIEQGTLWHRV